MQHGGCFNHTWSSSSDSRTSRPTSAWWEVGYDGDLGMCAYAHNGYIYIYVNIVYKDMCVCICIIYIYIYTWDYWVALCLKIPWCTYLLIYLMRSFLVFVYRFYVSSRYMYVLRYLFVWIFVFLHLHSMYLHWQYFFMYPIFRLFINIYLLKDLFIYPFHLRTDVTKPCAIFQ